MLHGQVNPAPRGQQQLQIAPIRAASAAHRRRRPQVHQPRLSIQCSNLHSRICGTFVCRADEQLLATTPWINAWYLLYQRCVDEVNRSWFQASKHPGPQPQQKDHLCPCPGGVPKELVAHWLLRNVESHSSLELLKVVKLCMSTLVVSRSPPRCLPARLHI